MSAGYWVFAWGGLFDSRSAEEKAYLHVVNLPELEDGATLCGLPRFDRAPTTPGGAWRPTAVQYERDAGMGDGKPGVVCPKCADAMLTKIVESGALLARLTDYQASGFQEHLARRAAYESRTPE